jgi:hypothetical protein
MVSYNCESATVELSKDLAIKAAATVMVTQASQDRPNHSTGTRAEAYKHSFGPKSSYQEGLPRPARRIQGSRHRG